MTIDLALVTGICSSCGGVTRHVGSSAFGWRCASCGLQQELNGRPLSVSHGARNVYVPLSDEGAPQES